jgi:hypothetical protein
LILTGCRLPDFTKSGFADLALDLAFFRFVWGPAAVRRMSSHIFSVPIPPVVMKAGTGRSGVAPWKQNKNRKHRDLSLAEFLPALRDRRTVVRHVSGRATEADSGCLITFRSHPKAAARLKLRLVDLEMIELRELGKWRPHMVDVTDRDLAIA